MGEILEIIELQITVARGEHRNSKQDKINLLSEYILYEKKKKNDEREKKMRVVRFIKTTYILS